MTKPPLPEQFQHLCVIIQVWDNTDEDPYAHTQLKQVEENTSPCPSPKISSILENEIQCLYLLFIAAPRRPINVISCVSSPFYGASVPGLWLG